MLDEEKKEVEGVVEVVVVVEVVEVLEGNIVNDVGVEVEG